MEIKGSKVLIVEDNDYIRLILMQFFEEFGAEYRAVEDGFKAKEILEAGEKFDLIISDNMMPKLYGVELLKWARGNLDKSISQVKFILTTGLSETLTEKTAIELGANAFAIKPYKLMAIKTKIENL